MVERSGSEHKIPPRCWKPNHWSDCDAARPSKATIHGPEAADARFDRKNEPAAGPRGRELQGLGQAEKPQGHRDRRDSGIGRAVAIAYAREGADVLIAYLNEEDDAQEVKALVEKEGRKAVLVSGASRS